MLAVMPPNQHWAIGRVPPTPAPAAPPPPPARPPHLRQALPAAGLVVAAGAGGALAVAAAHLAARQGALCALAIAAEEHGGKPGGAGGASGKEALIAHSRAALAPLAQRVGAGLGLQGRQEKGEVERRVGGWPLPARPGSPVGERARRACRLPCSHSPLWRSGPACRG